MENLSTQENSYEFITLPVKLQVHEQINGACVMNLIILPKDFSWNVGLYTFSPGAFQQRVFLLNSLTLKNHRLSFGSAAPPKITTSLYVATYS